MSDVASLADFCVQFGHQIAPKTEMTASTPGNDTGERLPKLAYPKTVISRALLNLRAGQSLRGSAIQARRQRPSICTSMAADD